MPAASFETHGKLPAIDRRDREGDVARYEVGSPAPGVRKTSALPPIREGVLLLAAFAFVIAALLGFLPGQDRGTAERMVSQTSVTTDNGGVPASRLGW